jgi:hypothetical protein
MYMAWILSDGVLQLGWIVGAPRTELQNSGGRSDLEFVIGYVTSLASCKYSNVWISVSH